jgi:hypothetical protein
MYMHIYTLTYTYTFTCNLVQDTLGFETNDPPCYTHKLRECHGQ